MGSSAMKGSDEILSASDLSSAQDAYAREMISTVLRMVLTAVLALTGMCVNTNNMVVFYKMGLSDGVTQNFFILSFSDGFFATVCLTYYGVSYVVLGGGGGGGGGGSSAVERVTPGEEVPGSIPAVAARSLLVWSVSV